MTPEQADALRKPFQPNQIGKLPKLTCPSCIDPKKDCTEHRRARCRTCKAYVSTEHMHIDYVGHAHVRERLLEVDPEWNWRPLAISPMGLPQLDEAGGLWIELTIGGITRLGYGWAKGGPATRAKELIGNALRNAGQSFGIALDLWKKEALEPVADTATPEPVLSPAERANTIRNLILATERRRGHNIAWVDGEFNTWTRGEAEFRKADDPEQMEKFQQYLKELK